MFKFFYSCFVFTVVTVPLPNTRVFGQSKSISTIAGDRWANNSVNTAIFKKNPLITGEQVRVIDWKPKIK